jgi:hypothetical protein
LSGANSLSGSFSSVAFATKGLFTSALRGGRRIPPEGLPIDLIFNPPGDTLLCLDSKYSFQLFSPWNEKANSLPFIPHKHSSDTDINLYFSFIFTSFHIGCADKIMKFS